MTKIVPSGLTVPPNLHTAQLEKDIGVWESLPEHATNLEESLTQLYRLLLKFLAAGYQALTKRNPKRAWGLLWSKETVDTLESKRLAVGNRLDMAANLGSRNSSYGELLEMKNKIDGIIEKTNKSAHTETIVQALNVEIDLQRLGAANRAAYSVVDENKESIHFDYYMHGRTESLRAVSIPTEQVGLSSKQNACRHYFMLSSSARIWLHQNFLKPRPGLRKYTDNRSRA